MSKSLNTYSHPTHDEIAARALQIYELEGRPEGRATQHWLMAEAQLIAARQTQLESKPVAKAPRRAVAKNAEAPKVRVSKRVTSTLPIATKKR